MFSILEILTKSPYETQKLGRTLGTIVTEGDVVLLVGELGTGKTCLTQGIAKGLGIKELVRSPTFMLINEYQGRLKLYHADFYRLDNLDEIWDLGIDEYISGDGLFVAEWAEKGIDVFPEEHLIIQIEYVDKIRRKFLISSKGSKGNMLQEHLKNSVEQQGR